MAANSSSTGQSTLVTIINRDLPQPKLGPRTAPKKGTKPLKSTIARPSPAVNIPALLVLTLGASKAAPKTTIKATVKGAIGKKAPPKARTTPLERPTRKINKR